MTDASPVTGADRPAVPDPVRVVRGDPTAEELAAVLAILAAARASAGAPARWAPEAGWSARSAGLRRPIAPGRGVWRLSGLEKGTRTRASW